MPEQMLSDCNSAPVTTALRSPPSCKVAWARNTWIVLGSAAALACVAAGASWSIQKCAVMAAVFLASVGGSIGGIAFSGLCGVMLFRLPLDPLRVVQIMLACSIANQTVMTWSIRHDIDWHGLKIFLLGGMLGLPLGLWLLLHADHHIYIRVFGGFLMAYAGFMLVRSRATIRVQHPGLDLVAGALGGITSAVAAFPSPPVTIWCSLKGWDKQRQRAVFQPFILIVQTASMIAIGLATRSRAMHGEGLRMIDLLCIPAGLIGTCIGLAIYQRLSTRQFAIALNLLLIISGISFLG